MPQRATSRPRRSRNIPGLGWLTEKKVTYKRSVGKERAAMRKQHLEDLRYEKERKRLEADIAKSDKAIDKVETKIEKASDKQSAGGMSESKFEAMKARMEKEIEGYQRGIEQAKQRLSNPAASASQYRLAQAVLSGTARATRMSKKVAQEIVDRTPESTRSEFMRANPGFKEPTRNYRGATIEHVQNVGYRITIPARVARDGRAATIDVQTLPEAKIRIDQEFGMRRNPEGDMLSSTEYRLGYNLGQTDKNTAMLPKTRGELQAVFTANFGSAPLANLAWFEGGYRAGYGTRNPMMANPRRRCNPDSETEGDGSPEYEEAARTAELFHGRPIQEIIEVEEEVKTPRWYVSIGPLIKLKIRPLTSKRIVPLKFNTGEKDTVHLFTSPNGRQFYLRGGDQELDIEALGMGPTTKWFRDLMIIGEAREITYRDKKKFHQFSLTDYFHKLGEVTKQKPSLVYNSLAKKLEIVGGQYEIEMRDLIDGMSPGIVN